MPTFKALAITERKQKIPLTIMDFDEPSPSAHELLVENVVVAQNPIDWKQIDYDIGIGPLPWTNGGDIAGIVYKVGSGVTKFRVGDRVISFLPRTTARHGAYQTYSLTEEGRTVKLPDFVSFEDGATFPMAFVTAAAGIIDAFNVKLPSRHDPLPAEPNGEVLLVWGGSGSVGAFAIQVAKLSGFTVFATASPANFDYVGSVGADRVFDYHDANVVNLIRAAAGDKLSRVYDAISENRSAVLCVKTITSPTGGTVAIILDQDPPISTKKIVKIARTNAIVAEHRPEVGEAVYQLLDAGLRKNVLKPNKVTVMPGGLLGVNEGLKLGRKHQISGKKLVYRIAESKF